MGRLVFVILIPLLMACSPLTPTTVPTITPVDPQLKGVLRLIGRFVTAHGCPVAPNVALTNAHVVDLRPFDKDWPLYPMTWADGEGNEGVTMADRSDGFRDLAVIRPVAGQFPHWYQIASQAPVAGERVRFLGYDWKNRDSAYSERVFITRVTRIVSGNLIMHDSGTSGSSGSCVLNDAGEVVGINAWGKELDDLNEAGIAVGVWGELLKRQSVPVVVLE